jgi:hypothetical protein
MSLRRLTTSLFAVALAAAALPANAGSLVDRSVTVQMPPGPGVFISENVEYVATLPIDSPGVGGNIVKVGDQMRLYVTGVKGLIIYDITIPAVPVPMGSLPLPHFQNEDVEVSKDGKRVIIATDTVAADPYGRNVDTGIRVIDTSNPMVPQQVARYEGSDHTATCADDACEWIYGDQGNIYHFDPATNTITRTGNWGGNGHALFRDPSGLMISDTNPRLVLDVTDPSAPVVLASGSSKFNPDGYLQHNSVRPAALEWQTREPLAEEATAEEIAEYSKLRPGELLVGNSESNFNPSCDSAGGLSTWSMADFDKGKKLQQLEVFRPINGNWADGNPAINGLGCSGHWFTVTSDYYVTASWYEHGVRFFKIDPTDGHITQVGFFQPVATQAGQALWVPGIASDGYQYVYSVDYARGIDILKFKRAAPVPSQAQFDASWLANLGTVGPLAEAERFACSLAIRT